MPVPVASLRCCASCPLGCACAGGAPAGGARGYEVGTALGTTHTQCPGHVLPQIRRWPALGGHGERGPSVAWEDHTTQAGARPPRLALVALVLASTSSRSPRETKTRLPLRTALTSPRWIQERRVDTARRQKAAATSRLSSAARSTCGSSHTCGLVDPYALACRVVTNGLSPLGHKGEPVAGGAAAGQSPIPLGKVDTVDEWPQP